MSNDENPQGMLRFVEQIPQLSYKAYILTYSPIHNHDSTSKKILNTLRMTCKLYFFVQRHKYLNQSEVITDEEIAYLREIGEVYVMEGKVPHTTRSSQFETFIQKYI
jgi:hypothetical protein